MPANVFVVRTVQIMKRIEQRDGMWVGTAKFPDADRSFAERVARWDALCAQTGLTLLDLRCTENDTLVEFTVRLGDGDDPVALTDALSALSILGTPEAPLRRRSRMGFPGESFDL